MSKIIKAVYLIVFVVYIILKTKISFCYVTKIHQTSTLLQVLFYEKYIELLYSQSALIFLASTVITVIDKWNIFSTYFVKIASFKRP